MGPIEKKARKLTNRSVLCARQAPRLAFVRTPCFGCTTKYLLMSRQGCTQFYWLLAENNSFGSVLPYLQFRTVYNSPSPNYKVQLKVRLT